MTDAAAPEDEPDEEGRRPTQWRPEDEDAGAAPAEMPWGAEDRPDD